MKYSFALAAIAATASAADVVSQITDGQPQAPTYTNGFTSYLSETNSLGVVTGMPSIYTSVVTTQPTVVTSQPVAVTSQPAAATSPAGSHSVSVPTVAPVPSGPSGVAPVGTGAASSGFATVTGGSGNTTVSTGKPSGSGSSETGSSGSSETGSSGSSATGTSGNGASSTASGSGSAASTGAAAFLQPAVGLGFAGALFAAFL